MSIPTVCWDWPGFKACHTEAGHQTYRFCDGLHEVGSPAFKECYSKVFAEKVQIDCIQGTGCGAAAAKKTTSQSPKTGGASEGPTHEVFVQDGASAFADPNAGRKWVVFAGSALAVGGLYYFWKAGGFR